MPSFSSLALTAAGLASLVAGQFPPTPEGQKVVQSRHHEGVKISYKEVNTNTTPKCLYEY